jgi:glycosyltransferase involved in cell wall biosynthesis
MPPTDDQLRLSVILPTYGRPESLGRCLEGLAAGRRLPEETLVVAQASDPEAGALEAVLAPFRERLGVRLIWAERAGQIHQMNCGLAAATGEVVCFTDDDCVPRAEWLERLAAPYRDPTVSGVGGRDVVHHGDRISAGPGRVVGRITWYGRVVGNHHLDFPPGLREVEHLKGANMSFRREITPPLDPRMVLGPGTGSLNDTELSLAVRARGGRLLYDPEARVDHYPAARHGGTHRDLAHPEQVFLDAHNWAYCVYKHSSGARRLAFLVYAFGVGCGNRPGVVKYLAAAVRAPRAATRQWLTAVRGLRAGIRDWRERD